MYPGLRRVCAVVLVLAGAPAAAAQQSAVVEELAPILAAEDARQWNAELFRRSLVASDSLVRRTAALAVGRIGDPRGTALLVPLLQDPDSTVRVEAAFALGLLRDTAAIEPLIDRLTGLPALDGPTALEAATALARIGGPRAGAFAAGVLENRIRLTVSDSVPVRQRLLLEAWRLGPDAPVAQLVPYIADTGLPRRSGAVYSVGRLRAAEAGNALLPVLRDQDPVIRSFAARTFTRQYVDSAGLAPASVTELLLDMTADDDARVRVNVLRALATYRDSALAGRVAERLEDPVANVAVQAAATLGELGGAQAVAALRRLLDGRRSFAVRREALLGLARADIAAFRAAAAGWRQSADWRERAVAAEGWGIAASSDAGDPEFLRDRDGRVIAAGLQSWSQTVEGPVPALLAAARPLLTHADAAVRSVAADVVARAADPADIARLTDAYRRAARDSFPEGAISALGALAAIARGSPSAGARVSREFLQTSARPKSYVIRRWAEDNWPSAAAVWGPSRPIATGRTLEDYRDLARQFLVTPDSTARPRVVIETEQQCAVTVELLGPEAPLTVANFLRLVDRRFFDGNRWHRVVPNFVVQDGDPRGDGWGGPGGTIRDEINRRRYDAPMLGMALSGPDTGSSQWFINLSPQPHLDGIYTIFGQVVAGLPALQRIVQGDVIRAIRR